MTENKRFMLDDAGELIDKETAQFIEYGEKVCDLLNEQDETIQALKEKLCELGVSDVKYKGKRYDTGLEEWLE